MFLIARCGSHSNALYTACLVGLLKATKMDAQPVDILGFSMGGGIIQHFVDAHPDLVRCVEPAVEGI